MRTRDALRTAIDKLARRNHRSLSEECEARLEQSLRDDRVLDALYEIFDRIKRIETAVFAKFRADENGVWKPYPAHVSPRDDQPDPYPNDTGLKYMGELLERGEELDLDIPWLEKNKK